MAMSPEIALVRNNMLLCVASAMRDDKIQRLVDDELISANPSVGTMYVRHGILSKEVRFIRKPSQYPAINDLIYALQKS